MSLSAGVSGLQALLTEIERSILFSWKERRDDQFKDFFKKVEELKDFHAHENERRIIPWHSSGVKAGSIAFENLSVKKKDKKLVIFYNPAPRPEEQMELFK